MSAVWRSDSKAVPIAARPNWQLTNTTDTEKSRLFFLTQEKRFCYPIYRF
jgi:hypothetical protein